MIDADYSEGFTYSYRKKWKNPVFRNLLEAAIWAWMCDAAAWKDTRIRFNGELVEVKRGQLVTSVRFISDGFGIGDQVTRTFLGNIQKDGMVNIQPTHRGTIITICNYDKYQSSENPANTQSNEQPTNSQQTANTNKKKDKELKERKESIEHPDWLPETEWNAFKAMRVKIKKPMTDHAEILAIGKLEKFIQMGHDPAAILNQSILNDWQDLYEPKGENNANTRRNTTKNLSKSERARAAILESATELGYASGEPRSKEGA